MGMTRLLRIVAAPAMLQMVSGAYTCPNGWTDKSGEPACAGAMSSTCSTATCCDAVPTCASFATAWVLSQAAGGGCAGDTKFFDLKKTDVEVAAPEGEAEVKSACCTPFADAQCSDWAAVLGSCDSGKVFVGTNSAPADGSNGMLLSQSKYQELCCIETPQTCSSFSAAWIVSQALGGGCAGDTKFFDLKKTDVEVAAPEGEAEVKSACCTPFADAQCSDWASVMGSCDSGTFIVGTNSAPADGSNGISLSQSKYQELCCDPPMKCASASNLEGEVSSDQPCAASLVVSLSALAAMVVA